MTSQKFARKKLGIKKRLKSASLHLNQNPSNDMIQLFYQFHPFFPTSYRKKSVVGGPPISSFKRKSTPKKPHPCFPSSLEHLPQIHGENIDCGFFLVGTEYWTRPAVTSTRLSSVVSAFTWQRCRGFCLCDTDQQFTSTNGSSLTGVSTWMYDHYQTHIKDIISDFLFHPFCFGNRCA